MVDVSFVAEPDLGDDVLGCVVGVEGDGTELGEVVVVERDGDEGSGGFGGVALMPGAAGQGVADLDEGFANGGIDGSEAATSDDDAVCPVGEDPLAVAMGVIFDERWLLEVEAIAAR